MSKASEWAKTAAASAPDGLDGGPWSVQISLTGMVIKFVPARIGLDLTPEDAMTLARWILDTFGEEPLTGNRP